MLKQALDAKAYISPKVYKKEIKRIFATTWQYVGHIEKVQQPGDFFVCEVAGESLIVMRGNDDELRGFYNVCAHRATRLLSGEGCKRRISCPYHGWTYDQAGELIRVPNGESIPGFKLADYRLGQCRVAELHGMIFVNLDAQCDDLQATMPGLEALLKSYSPRLPELRFAHRTEALLETNWKVAVENYSECYHCALVHKSFFAASEADGVDASSYRIDLRGNWHLHTAEAFNQDSEVDHANQFAAWWLWPNFAVQSHPGCVLNVRKWTPLSCDRTRVEVDWYFLPGEFGEDELKMVEHHAVTVFAEDIPLVEDVQKGLHSRSYEPGPLMIDPEGTERSEHAVGDIQNLWRQSMA